MKDVQETCRIAVIQAEPVMFDKAGGLKKALRCIRNAAAEEAELIVFPELFIPGYPIGMNFGFSMGKRTEAGRADWKRYYDASLIAGGEEFKQLSDAAKDAKAYVSMGFSERDAINGTLYNSNVIFSPDGSWSVHRKLKPTGSERLVWGDANRDYFPVVETPWGPIGSMICWESYMPLARVALYQKGITIYISPNTNDNPEWQPPSGISPSRGNVTSSTAIWWCVSPLIPRICRPSTTSRTSPIWSAGAAAASSTPTGMR